MHNTIPFIVDLAIMKLDSYHAIARKTLYSGVAAYMNNPPKAASRIDYGRLRDFVYRAACASGLVEEKAEILAELLTTNEVRGVVSHGTQQIVTYSRLLREKKLNPAPEVRIVSESPASLLVDGDGGLGYFPAFEGNETAR